MTLYLQANGMLIIYAGNSGPTTSTHKACSTPSSLRRMRLRCRKLAKRRKPQRRELRRRWRRLQRRQKLPVPAQIRTRRNLTTRAPMRKTLLMKSPTIQTRDEAHSTLWKSAQRRKIRGQGFYLCLSLRSCSSAVRPTCQVRLRFRIERTLKLTSVLASTAFTDSTGQQATRLVIGLVGYPNVGKSSTINALLGEKKVSVSSTPGKTKHFQTIHLSPSLVLCDCPGLVFPQFATTKADLVCDGVLPIDQLREHTGPIGLVVKRIPKQILEAIYGLSVRTRGVEEGGDGKITGTDLLVAYASTYAYC